MTGRCACEDTLTTRVLFSNSNQFSRDFSAIGRSKQTGFPVPANKRAHRKRMPRCTEAARATLVATWAPHEHHSHHSDAAATAPLGPLVSTAELRHMDTSVAKRSLAASQAPRPAKRQRVPRPTATDEHTSHTRHPVSETAETASPRDDRRSSSPHRRAAAVTKSPTDAGARSGANPTPETFRVKRGRPRLPDPQQLLPTNASEQARERAAQLAERRRLNRISATKSRRRSRAKLEDAKRPVHDLQCENKKLLAEYDRLRQVIAGRRYSRGLVGAGAVAPALALQPPVLPSFWSDRRGLPVDARLGTALLPGAEAVARLPAAYPGAPRHVW